MADEQGEEKIGSTADAARSLAKSKSQDGLSRLNTGVKASEGLTEINRDFQESETLERARERGLPYVDLAKTPLNPDYLRIVPLEEANNALAVPFFLVGNKLRLAVQDEKNPQTLKLIERLKNAGFEIDITLASSAGIKEALEYFFDMKDYKEKEIVEKVDVSQIQSYEEEIKDLASLPVKMANLTAEESLNMINIAAMKTGSSDVHYEPQEGKIPVRFRIDGLLHKVFELSPKLYEKISNQIKYESKMQLNIYSVPQDGRYTFNYNQKKIGVRVSSLPTPFGESFVCRFLSGAGKSLDFVSLGFQGEALRKIETCTSLSQGMVLVTGPTGSGKSTTLYTLLTKMNTPQNKVISLEDPVEYPVTGITQSQIDEKRGYNFASGLRAILRQDPDVVMIGEIRDHETAETSAQASLTGHVLLSTLHTNSALETIPRLINMGLKPFMVAPALHTIVAQRLVRKVCPNCSTKININESQKNEYQKVFGNLKTVNSAFKTEIPQEIAQVKGCEKCSHTGYKGRLVICEVIEVDPELKDLIMSEASIIEMIQHVRKKGMITMREDGFIKVAQGLTTLEEVYRVTNVDEAMILAN